MHKQPLKWNVPVDDQDHPIGAGKVLLVACQRGPDTVQVWTEERRGSPPRVRRARVYGTGQDVPVHDVHVGSAVPATAAGALVWHVYAADPAAPTGIRP